MRDSILKRWLTENNCFHKKGITRHTHLCLDGGVLSISEDLTEEFYEVYIKGINAGDKYYITEYPTDIFRFFADIDIKEDYAWSEEKFKIALYSIQKVIHELYNHPHNVIVCGTASKIIIEKGTKLYKTGFHLHWPDIYVTRQMANKLRIKVVERLVKDFGERDSINPWDDVYDSCVYRNNTIRILHSRKMARKKNKKGQTMYQDEGRAYTPLFSHPDKTLVEENSDKLDIFKKTIVRTPRGTMFTPVEIKENKKVDNTFEEYEDDGDDEIWNNVYASTGSKIIDKIESWLFNSSEFPWKIQFEKICKCSDYCYWIKLRNNYQPAKCMNTGRCHTSSGIYFVITPNGLYQKCHCIKDTMNGRKYDLCSKFRSKVIPNGHGLWQLPLVIKNHLFPEKKKENPIKKLGNKQKMVRNVDDRLKKMFNI